MKEVPVLIAGGGPVGMTLAKTLASFGIECMLVEKNPSTTRHPRWILQIHAAWNCFESSDCRNTA